MERHSITALASLGEMATGAALHNYVKSFASGPALGVPDDKSHSQTMSGNPHLWQEFYLEYQNYFISNNVMYLFLLCYINLALLVASG